jgi:antitoxin PrlF
MAPLTAKVSSKAQTVLPKPVREKLGVKPGDTVRFRETNEGVVIEKVEELVYPDDWGGDPFASFTEWATPEEDDAWKDL